MHLITYPSAILRAAAAPVVRVGKNERRLLRRMLRHMRRWKGIGLAASQVGRLEQVIVAELDGQNLTWANPTILEQEGTENMEEGCLSIPGTTVDVVRAARVWVRALNEENKKVERKLEGLLARVVQHEIDHLSGVLIIDHGPPITHEGLAEGQILHEEL